MSRASTALIAVDLQRDFLPGGSLAVAESEAVVAPLQQLAKEAGLVVATRDFHPRHHVSFVERGGPWPPHCVIGTPGAGLHPDVDAMAGLVVSKGMNPDVEAYSGFDGTGLAGMLRSAGIDRVIIGGVATDYCVRATALAAREEGFATEVVLPAIRAVDAREGDGARAIEEMAAAGVSVRELL